MGESLTYFTIKNKNITFSTVISLKTSYPFLAYPVLITGSNGQCKKKKMADKCQYLLNIQV